MKFSYDIILLALAGVATANPEILEALGLGRRQATVAGTTATQKGINPTATGSMATMMSGSMMPSMASGAMTSMMPSMTMSGGMASGTMAGATAAATTGAAAPGTAGQQEVVLGGVAAAAAVFVGGMI